MMHGKIRLLWVSGGDPDPQDATVIQQLCRFSVELARSAGEAFHCLKTSRFDVVLANFPVPGWTITEFLEEVQRIPTLIPVIVRDPAGTVTDAVRAAKLGADQVLTGSLDPNELSYQLETAAEDFRRRDLALLGSAVSHEPWKRLLVGESRAMQDVERIVRLVGARRCTVLITGETGTGKEMVARALHLAGPRSSRPMIAVNCSALPESLLEAELFGHVKGAFTGAVQQRIGRFEQAHGSTLFLDEIGDMPLETQAKLLRVLQEREFQRLGSSETIQVDVRVIAATNLDLEERVLQGKFREDLYYRLNVVPIEMPPLRQRLSDIPVLVYHFIDKICRLENLPVKQITRETLDRLAGRTWPGNVRQLENAVETAIALSGDRSTLYPGDFRLSSSLPAKANAAIVAPVLLPEGGLDFEQTVSRIERQILEQALRRTGGNKKLAAEMLRLKRTTLSAKLRSLEAWEASTIPN